MNRVGSSTYTRGDYGDTSTHLSGINRFAVAFDDPSLGTTATNPRVPEFLTGNSRRGDDRQCD